MLNFSRSAIPIKLVACIGPEYNVPVSDPTGSADYDTTTPALLSLVTTPSTLDIIKRSVPSLSDKSFAFKPSLMTAQGDIQTLFCNAGQIDGPLCYDRYFVPAEGGGTLALDFLSTPWLPVDAPIVIIIPGLVGSSQDMYVNSAARELSRLRDGPIKGYKVVVMNPRGTLDIPLTSPHFTHAGSTEDIRTVASFVLRTCRGAKGVFALGVSMGGGLLSNYLAEEGVNSLIDAGFCISTVWDFQECSARIEKGRFNHRLLYSYGCGTRLTGLVRKHERVFREAGSVGLDEIVKHHTARMSTFSDTFMSHLAEYPDTATFAAASSPIYRIGNIRRPCVFLNARDDPFYGGDCLASIENAVRESGRQELVLAITERGGHIGWLQKDEEGRWEQWFIHPTREFFDTISLRNMSALSDDHTQ